MALEKQFEEIKAICPDCGSQKLTANSNDDYREEWHYCHCDDCGFNFKLSMKKYQRV